MAWIVIVAAVVLAAVTVGYFFVGRSSEEASGSSDLDRSTSAQFFGDHNDRPAGPGAEADGVAGRGQIVPGPSAEAGGVTERTGRDSNAERSGP